MAAAEAPTAVAPQLSSEEAGAAGASSAGTLTRLKKGVSQSFTVGRNRLITSMRPSTPRENSSSVDSAGADRKKPILEDRISESSETKSSKSLGLTSGYDGTTFSTGDKDGTLVSSPELGLDLDLGGPKPQEGLVTPMRRCGSVAGERLRAWQPASA